MDEQLPGRLGDVQIVFKELVDNVQRLLVQGVDGVLLKDLGEEHFAQRRGQLIDQPGNAEILVVDDFFLVLEDLDDVDGDLGFLVAVGQLAEMVASVPMR